MTAPIYDRVPTYDQFERHLQMMAGIHAKITGEIADDDWPEFKKAVVNGGGPAMFPVGSIITTVKDTYSYPWAVMHHGQHADGRYYMILRVIKAVDKMMFDQKEAFFYAESGLTAGTYHINVPTAYGQCVVGNYQFTLGSDVPAGGRLEFSGNPYSATPVGMNVRVYDSANSMTVAQTAVISSGEGGVKLGDLQAGGDSNVANMNSIQRACFGNNNYAQSAIRQYFNSDAAAGSVWKSSNKFDMAPDWNATQPGFLRKLPQGFIDIVNAVTISTDTNNVFEVDYTKSSSYTLKDKFWLPSRYNVYGSVESGNFSEDFWDYYNGAANIDRIIYDTGGTARYAFLRSPGVGSANSVRCAGGSTGELNDYSASNGHAECPACEISESKLAS